MGVALIWGPQEQPGWRLSPPGPVELPPGSATPAKCLSLGSSRYPSGVAPGCRFHLPGR